VNSERGCIDMFADPSRLSEIVDKLQAKVEVYRPQCIIRITADKPTALQTLENLDSVRSSVQSRDYKPRPLQNGSLLVSKDNGRRPFNYLCKEDLDLIADLTKTAYVLSKDNVLNLRSTLNRELTRI
jgi:hypothetical protein